MSTPAAGLPLWLLSWVVWRLVPNRGPTKMAEFSHTEAGSGEDMLLAVEETPRRELRARYFRHALDELKHARMFRERAAALSQRRGRAQAVLEDAGYITRHGITASDSLFRQLGELEFLAFVWVAESRGAEQFEIYADLMRDDVATAAMFDEIARDERFHISYSRAELDRYCQRGQAEDVRWAVLRVRARRWWQGWLRFAHDLGATVSGLWLSLLYLVLLGPFALIARVAERRVSGFVAPAPRPPAAERARWMA